MSSTILDDAEARLAPAAASAQTRQREIIEAMREVIGRPHYEQAKVELPKLEQFIAKESRPFLDHLKRISQQKKTPLPPSVMAWVREMSDACMSGADWVRAGIDEWDHLAPPFVNGTQQIDERRRTTEVASLRVKLMNWNGRRSRLRDLKVWIERYIQESGWPATQPGATTIAPAPH